MSISGHTALYAVLGRPVDHSRSPALHNAWFAALGIDAVYLALDVAPENGARLIEALRTLHIAGANLTVPHKQIVVAQLDSADDDVTRIGAANTVVRHGERFVGHNTDAQGFVRGFIESHGDSLSGRRALLLGAGGAALAVAKGLIDAGVAHIDICNRSSDPAQRLQQRLQGLGTPLRCAPLADAPRLAIGAELIVNALSSQGAPLAEAIDPAQLATGAVWCDLNYWMERPPGQDRCARAGVAYLTGDAMLWHQAALAFEHFTGMSPPALPITAAVE